MQAARVRSQQHPNDFSEKLSGIRRKEETRQDLSLCDLAISDFRKKLNSSHSIHDLGVKKIGFLNFQMKCLKVFCPI